MLALRLQQPEQLHRGPHMLSVRQHHPEQLHRGRHLQATPVKPARAAVPTTIACSKPELFEQEPVPEQRRHVGTRHVDGPGTWTAGVWSPATWTPANRNTWNGSVTDRGLAAGPGTAAGNDQTIVAAKRR